MDFNERVIPGISANFLFQEAISRYHFALKFISSGKNVLDVGCGTGYGTHLISQKTKVTGVDIDAEAIGFAKSHYFGPTYIQSSAERLPFAKEIFDVVCSFEVIEHIENPRNLIKEVRRVLKKKGKFIISTPNKSVISPHSDVSSPYHFREYTYDQLYKFLKQYFNHVEIFGQTKSPKAQEAFSDFMNSQKARESLVQSDKLGIRQIIPDSLKEFIWKYVGGFFGRKTQDYLSYEDFPISKTKVKESEFFLVVSW